MREEEGSREERRVKGEGRKKGRKEKKGRGERKRKGRAERGEVGGSRRRVCHSQLGGLAAPQVFLSSSDTADGPGPRLCLFVTRDTVLPTYK